MLSVLPYLFYFITCLILCDFQHKATDVAKAQEFLSMLPGKGRTAFERFIAALMSCGENQNFIAKELDPELARKYEACPVEATDITDRGGHVARRFKSDEDIIEELSESPATTESGHAQGTCFGEPTILLLAGPKKALRQTHDHNSVKS